MKLLLKMAWILPIVFGVACSTRPPQPQQVEGDDYRYTQEYLNWMINEQMVENDIVGLSIALLDNDRVVWSQGYGYADEAKDIKATAHSLYRAGSITKLFTATAVMQLVERGLIDIDKPLQHYLPEFDINSRFAVEHVVTAAGRFSS